MRKMYAARRKLRITGATDTVTRSVIGIVGVV